MQLLDQTSSPAEAQSALDLLWKCCFLTLFFFGLGIGFAKLWWGWGSRRLKAARAEHLQLTGRTNEIVETQGLLLSKLQKTSAVYRADLEFRDNKILKLQNDFNRLQTDLTTKIKSESTLSGELRTREREIERFKKDLAKAEGLTVQLDERDHEIHALREDLSTKEGVYARLGELEGILGERDEELELLRNDNYDQNEQIELLNVELEEKSNAIDALEKSSGSTEETQEKITLLEEALARRDHDLSKLQNDLETTIRDRETKIMELEDTLSERESRIDSLQNEGVENGATLERIQDFENLLAERDLEIEELSKNTVNQQELEELVEQLRQRDSEIQNIKNQYHESKEQREANLKELSEQVEAQNAELVSLRNFQSASDKMTARIEELEWILGEKEAEIESLSSEESGSEETNSRIQELEWMLGERNNEVERLVFEKGDLVNQLRIKDDDLLRKDRIGNDSLSLRVEDLERVMRDRDLEVVRLAKEKQELTHLLRITENDMESMRKDRHSYDQIQNRIEDMERVVSERDVELERLKTERAALSRQLAKIDQENIDLTNQLRSSQSDTKLLRVDRVSQENLNARIRDLEKSLVERNGDVSNPNPHGEAKFVHAERSSRDALQDRIRDLERLVGDRSRETRPIPPSDPSEFRFTLEDGTVTYLKGDETIEYEGKTHRAEELYYLLRDREIG